MSTDDTNAGPPPTVWPCLSYADAPAAIDWLVEAFGFEEVCRYPGEGDDGRDIAHAELRWPLGGGVMMGSPPKEETERSPGTPGSGFMYVVTDDPDALFERATKAGAEVIEPLVDADYGNRGFTVKDPEGHRWSFGVYRGE
jgi:uncharacterized glyoxalase superfamily protein PhnB